MALNFLLKRSGTANKRPDPASMALGELDLNYDAVSGGVFYKDSAGDVVKVGSAQVSATAPNATPAGSAGNSDGEFWYDTSTTTLKIWNGSAWVSISGGGGGGVAGVTGTTPITVDNTDPANPVVGVDSASTSTSGVVQLNDSTSSTSTTEAATANAVKTAYDAGVQGQTDAATAQATADAAVPDASYTALGAILTGTGAGTYAALTLGADTNVLTVDTTCPGGLKWAAGGGGGGTLATPTACGVVFGCSNTDTNTSLGYLAIEDLCGTSVRNVAMGVNAMNSLTTSHCCNIAIGYSAMYGSNGSANFRCNVAIGNASMANVTGTNIINNVYVGASTAASGTGSNNVAVGFCSQSANCGSGNTSVGSTSLAINTGNNNVAVGLNAGCTLGSTAACNILIGPGAGGGGSVGSITGSANVIIGIDKAPPVPAGSTQLVLGNWLTGCSTLAIKPAAGIMDCALSTGTAGQVLMSNGSNAICWGAPPAAQSATRGTVYGYANVADVSNTAIGKDAFEGCAGLCNTAMGNEALLNTVALDTDNVAIGFRAGKLLSSVCFNTAVGSCSMGAASSFGASCNTAVGYGSAGQICGVSNTAVGANALCFAVLATCNVAVGGNAGRCLSTGSCNTLLGANTGVTVGLNTGSNNTVIGFNASTAAIGTSNTITLGNASITTIRAQVTTITSLSDARDKTDVTALPVGLDFVKSLNPVKFTWQMREPNEVKDGTSEAGFIAQDLKAAQEASGASYLGLIYDDNPEKLEASPGKLVPVLVKAIQELSERNDLLEARIATLEGN